MLFPPYLIHSQSTAAAQETTRLGCQDLGFLNFPQVKAGYTKQMTNKGRPGRRSGQFSEPSREPTKAGVATSPCSKDGHNVHSEPTLCNKGILE